MKIFLISPVRGISEGDRSAIGAYVAALEEKHTVYWPLRDTPQDDPVGVQICRDNRKAIEEADEVWLWWDRDSKGSIFDLGMAWALRKPLRLVRQPGPTPGKSFDNLLLYWQKTGPGSNVPWLNPKA